ncbi:MAG: UDP-3-O-(3-hydroxymyristoyl)glucosamine N-acyltransferase [Alphaproteobacteria bacterium]|nr:UDP-3-O-(3-hydroxymyristoyl)glucosamine N-acyltransferase [Alphaproteobacteria bacterium]
MSALPGPGCRSDALAAALGGVHHGPVVALGSLASLLDAGPGQLAYAERAPQGEAGCLLIRAPTEGRTCIVVPDPKAAFLDVLDAWHPPRRPAPGVHPSAVVEGALGPGCAVGPLVHVAATARVGADVVLHAGVVVGACCVVGDGSELHPGVVLYPDTVLGARVLVHANAVLGADGFSFHPTPQGLRKVRHVGRVVVEDDVEIGANTCVDRAFLDETRIGRGAKLDNLVQVGHNTTLGPGTVVAAQTGLSGSVRVGAGVQMGGQVGVVDHVTIGDGARLAAGSKVIRDVPAGEAMLGVPAMPRRRALRVLALVRRLPELLDR